jgi:hypothetical protein
MQRRIYAPNKPASSLLLPSYNDYSRKRLYQHRKHPTGSKSTQHGDRDFTPLLQPQITAQWDEGATVMILLMILALAGALSGSVSGALWGGSDGILLGATTGTLLGACVWLLTGSVLRELHEYRLNRYFHRDSTDES